MTTAENKVRIGGLFRCCILTVNDMEREGHVPREGERKACDYCKEDTLIYRDGAWEWVGLEGGEE